jgi:LDH2 family malate/lactate/ureidoglycolate dehydrogenase
VTVPLAAGALLVPPERLEEIVAEILLAAGADEEAAAIVAGSLVETDVRGVASHGVMRVAQYVAEIRDGRVVPTARPRCATDLGAMVALDGQGAFGQVAARELAHVAEQRARDHGLALVTLAAVTHVGRLGEWVERVALGGALAIAWCACGGPFGNVAPFGGRERRLGTNPIAYAVPAGSHPPVVADFSTSIVAEGKVRLLLQAGLPAPDGWLVDARGQSTTDPHALYAGGAIQPMGEHKGFAFSLLSEILGGILAGAGCASVGDAPGNGVVLVAIDPGRLQDAGDFGARVDAVLASLSGTPPAGQGPGVLIPGEPERATMRERRSGGVPLPQGTQLALIEAAHTVGLDLRAELAAKGDDRVP